MTLDILSQSSGSLWGKSVWPNLPVLRSDVTTDVCIIGAGMAGLCVAYNLQRAGVRTVILDRASPGEGESLRTTAHLSNVIDNGFANILKWHGESGAKLASQSHGRAIDWIERTADFEEIRCDFVRLNGFLFGAAESDDLKKEFAAVKDAGVGADWQLGLAISGLENRRCIRFPGQGQFNPAKFLAGLVRAYVAIGGVVYRDSAVVATGSGLCQWVQTERGHIVVSDWLVVASNSPIQNVFSIHTKQAAYRSYVVAAEYPTHLMEPALYWDTMDPYHYVRFISSSADKGYILVGGEDHKTGQIGPGGGRVNYMALAKWLRHHFPSAGAIRHQWSGQILETMDGLGFIGRNPDSGGNQLVVTGDSGMGMTHSAIGGELIADIVLGRQNDFLELYDPGRFRVGAVKDYLEENVNVARQYASWLQPSAEDSDGASLFAGEGMVVQRGLGKVAVCRDKEGVVFQCSAVCPHLGGIVGWNAAEQSWDCPCHGSRFKPNGVPICGPATAPLHQIETPRSEWDSGLIGRQPPVDSSVEETHPIGAP